MLTDTILEDDRWEEADLETLAETAAVAALSHLGMVPQDYEIAVLGCDDARIAVLNAEFRDKPTPTNVLSWPAWDLAAEDDGAAPEPAPEGDETMPEALGDIAISYDTCLAEAEAAGKPLADHVTHLVVHGVLHLLGYDHIRDNDATLMEGIETKILGKMGISDPYRE
ncbi:rRNA maturation RNase YbeY [Pseudoprimorskyibacter insulae]|uniref:Endoribonuclease YbeY n=1 Tax=Pseudoprimorskyibacter insulae TaxID=1695997 RepID=A0A2R8AYD7_9RHOB|nr:rRNA maturation RNase YbeY [Pseudoprimorskyibacter insulae]SPF81020.1 Endoribonuclease YbeY [Pseudoprimorskyibacter insulae]